MESDRIDGFLIGHQSLREFLAACNIDLAEVPPEMVDDLARRDGSYDFIWAWCRAGRIFGRSGRLTPVICALLARDDHKAHEELVDALQDLRDPTSIDCLFDCATRRVPYLDYNDSSSLGRRCVWALHDIGTPEAISRIGALAEDSREEVSGEAVARLEALRGRRATDEKLRYRLARDSKLGSL